MMGHNICFKGIIWKIIPNLSLLPILTWSTAYDFGISSILVNGYIFRDSNSVISIFDTLLNGVNF